MGQSYYSPISINSGQVPSTQSNFPVLINVTDNRFKTIGNGGHVNNSNGFDIRPYSDSGLTTALSYDLEAYGATTGQLIMWVKVASLSSSTTPIYLGYGDVTLTTDGTSGTNTFSNSYTSVYLMKNSVSLNTTDELAVTNLVQNGSPTSATGQVGTAAGLVHASSQYLSQGGNESWGAAFTVSGWVFLSSLPGSDFWGFYGRQPGAGNDRILINSSGKLLVSASATANVSYNGTGSHTLSTSTWYYLTEKYDSTNGLKGMVNAASDNTVSANGAHRTDSVGMFVGNDTASTSRYLDGRIDMFTISSVARSDDWITTEYNNQSAPGTFETLGTEVSLIASSTSNFFLLFN